MDRKLIKYLPQFMQTYAEIEQIMSAEQTQVEYLWQASRDLLKESFVSDETEIGASRWEKILGIFPLKTDTLQLRNFRIHGKLVEDLPYTYKTLNNQLKALCGENEYVLNLDSDNFRLIVKIELTRKKLKLDVEKLCERVVPLNLILDITLIFNPHRLFKRYTHGQLHAFTHQQIRDEPFK